MHSHCLMSKNYLLLMMTVIQNNNYQNKFTLCCDQTNYEFVS